MTNPNLSPQPVPREVLTAAAGVTILGILGVALVGAAHEGVAPAQAQQAGQVVGVGQPVIRLGTEVPAIMPGMRVEGTVDPMIIINGTPGTEEATPESTPTPPEGTIPAGSETASFTIYLPASLKNDGFNNAAPSPSAEPSPPAPSATPTRVEPSPTPVPPSPTPSLIPPSPSPTASEVPSPTATATQEKPKPPETIPLQSDQRVAVNHDRNTVLESASRFTGGDLVVSYKGTNDDGSPDDHIKAANGREGYAVSTLAAEQTKPDESTPEPRREYMVDPNKPETHANISAGAYISNDNMPGQEVFNNQAVTFGVLLDPKMRPDGELVVRFKDQYHQPNGDYWPNYIGLLVKNNQLTAFHGNSASGFRQFESNLGTFTPGTYELALSTNHSSILVYQVNPDRTRQIYQKPDRQPMEPIMLSNPLIAGTLSPSVYGQNVQDFILKNFYADFPPEPIDINALPEYNQFGKGLYATTRAPIYYYSWGPYPERYVGNEFLSVNLLEGGDFGPWSLYAGGNRVITIGNRGEYYHKHTEDLNINQLPPIPIIYRQTKLPEWFKTEHAKQQADLYAAINPDAPLAFEFFDDKGEYQISKKVSAGSASNFDFAMQEIRRFQQEDEIKQRSKYPNLPKEDLPHRPMFITLDRETPIEAMPLDELEKFSRFVDMTNLGVFVDVSVWSDYQSARDMLNQIQALGYRIGFRNVAERTDKGGLPIEDQMKLFREFGGTHLLVRNMRGYDQSGLDLFAHIFPNEGGSRPIPNNDGDVYNRAKAALLK